MEEKPKIEKPKLPVYRELNEEEKDTLFAYYDKHGGNVMGMSLDKDCPFHSRNQISCYRDRYGFISKLAQFRTERARVVVAGLNDSKIRAIEMAQRLLEPQHKLVFNKSGSQIFDADGKPLIVENLPHYKELKTAWEIIKAELGEPAGSLAIVGAKDLADKIQSILEDDKPETEEDNEGASPGILQGPEGPAVRTD